MFLDYKCESCAEPQADSDDGRLPPIPAIASHDEKRIAFAKQYADKVGLPKNGLEFQMLYGVTPDLRQELVHDGHRIRVYVPYGKDWFGYSTRRLKENPKIASHIIKSIFVRG